MGSTIYAFNFTRNLYDKENVWQRVEGYTTVQEADRSFDITKVIDDRGFVD